jgi:hypothetical protein
LNTNLIDFENFNIISFIVVKGDYNAWLS